MGHEEGETFDDAFAFAAAEIVEPDEAEGEGMVGIVGAGGQEGGPTGAAFGDEGAGEGGGEAMFEVRPGGDLVEAPAGELAGEGAAEGFAVDIAMGTAVGEAIGPGDAIDEVDGLGTAEESAGFKAEEGAGGFFELGEAEGEAAGVVPGVEQEMIGLGFERELVGDKEERFEAFLEDDGVLRAFEKIEDGLGESKHVDKIVG